MPLLPENVINPGQKEPIHTTTFVREQISTGKRQGGQWNNVGYVSPDGKPIPLEYLISVTSIRNHCTIVAPMQEPIRMEVESRWDPFIPSSILNEGNIIAQAVTSGKKSLITRASSRRIWQGSSPIRLNLKMKFQAVDNAMREVVEPVRLLQAIALPWSPSGDKGGKVSLAEESAGYFKQGDIYNGTVKFVDFVDSFPLLSPPGPTPFAVDGILDLGESASNRRVKENEIREGPQGGDIIVIEIGRFMTFYNVIVSKVSDEVPIMMTKDGDPVSATVDLTFETYEMITTNELARMYDKWWTMKRTDFFTKVAVNGIDERDFLHNPISTFPMHYKPVYYRVTAGDVMRPWIISYKCYGVVDFWWILLFLNNIENPFTDIVVGTILTVPNRLDIYEFAKKFRVV